MKTRKGHSTQTAHRHDVAVSKGRCPTGTDARAAATFIVKRSILAAGVDLGKGQVGDWPGGGCTGEYWGGCSAAPKPSRTAARAEAWAGWCVNYFFDASACSAPLEVLRRVAGYTPSSRRSSWGSGGEDCSVKNA